MFYDLVMLASEGGNGCGSLKSVASRLPCSLSRVATCTRTSFQPMN
jgi:hypothetical protein